MTPKMPLIAALCAALSLSACIEVNVDGADASGPPPNAGGRFDQTINFTRGTGGSGQLVQTFRSGAGRPSLSRICLQNQGPNTVIMAHETPGINNLTAAPGGQSCANFASSARVQFTLLEQLGLFPVPNTPDRNFVYTMGPFDGGLLTLVWKAN